LLAALEHLTAVLGLAAQRALLTIRNITSPSNSIAEPTPTTTNQPCCQQPPARHTWEDLVWIS